MEGRVTIFSTGKMISVAAKSIKKSTNHLDNAKKYLMHEKITKNVHLIPQPEILLLLLT